MSEEILENNEDLDNPEQAEGGSWEDHEDKSEPDDPEHEDDLVLKEYVDQIQGDVDRVTKFKVLTDDQKREIIEKALISLPVTLWDDGSIQVELSQKANDRYYRVFVEPWLREKFGSDGRLLTQAHMEADRLFCATILATINKTQRELGEESATNLAHFTREQYFASSPNISSYVGGVGNQIEILSLASRGSVSRGIIAYAVRGGIVLNNAFGSGNYLVDVFDSKGSVEQINLLNIEANLAKSALAKGDWAQPFVGKARSAFEQIVFDEEISPLVRIVAVEKMDSISGHDAVAPMAFGEEPISPQESMVLRKQEESYQKMLQDQALLHSEYPDFNGDDFLTLIAPGVCASGRGGKLDVMSDKYGKKANILDWQSDNEFGIAEDDMFLIQVMHEPGTKSTVEFALRDKLVDIPLETQLRFVRFMAEADTERYDRLVARMARFDDHDEKMQMMNAFLSLEFGDDFGDRLITISEKLDSELSQRVYRNINQTRQHAEVIAGYFDGAIEGMADAIETAFIKRTTELLAIIASDKSTYPEMYEAFSALDIMSYAIGQIKQGIGSPVSGHKDSSSDENADHITLKTNNNITMTIRPVEQEGKNNQRIGFTVRIPEEMIPSSVEKSKNLRLSLRLDFDEFGLALDLGSGRQGNVKASPVGVFIGEQLSKGEAIMAPAKLHGNHVREAFDGIDIDEKDFFNLAYKFVANLDVIDDATVPDSKKRIA